MLRMAGCRSDRIITTFVLLFGISLLSGCAGLAGGGFNSPTSTVAISPTTANVRAGDTLQFTAKVSDIRDQSVVWSVNGTVGGNATIGKINTSGLYTAPAALPTPNTVTIEATSASDKTLSGKTDVSLENPIPTVTAVSPTAVPVGSFWITITGTNFVSGAKVTLAGQALTTKFVSSTQLTATGTTTASQLDTSVPLQSLFNNQHLAVLANVGTLIQPTTPAQFQSEAPLCRSTSSRIPIRKRRCKPQFSTKSATPAGQAAWRIRFKPFTVATFRSSSHSQAPTFSAKASWRKRSSRTEIRRSC